MDHLIWKTYCVRCLIENLSSKSKMYCEIYTLTIISRIPDFLLTSWAKSQRRPNRQKYCVKRREEDIVLSWQPVWWMNEARNKTVCMSSIFLKNLRKMMDTLKQALGIAIKQVSTWLFIIACAWRWYKVSRNGIRFELHYQMPNGFHSFYFVSWWNP